MTTPQEAVRTSSWQKAPVTLSETDLFMDFTGVGLADPFMGPFMAT